MAPGHVQTPSNKLAAGISDTLALGLLNEAIGAELPIIAAPFPNQMLARHPVFAASVATLPSWGVHLVFNPERYPLPVPNQGESGNSLFPWPALHEELRALRAGTPERGPERYPLGLAALRPRGAGRPPPARRSPLDEQTRPAGHARAERGPRELRDHYPARVQVARGSTERVIRLRRGR